MDISGLGGVTGLYKGLRATTLAGQVGKVRRTQVVNYIMKQGTCGICSVFKINKIMQNELDNDAEEYIQSTYLRKIPKKRCMDCVERVITVKTAKLDCMSL